MSDEYGLLEQARSAKREIFTKEGQAEEYADERALGIMVAQALDWDCRRIFEAVYAAMEEANMHTENKALVQAAVKMGALPSSERRKYE